MKLLLLFAFVIWWGIGHAEDAFLCYGPNFMYTTSAPKGWKLDNNAGKPNKLCLVSYPENSSWEKGESVIYLNPSAKGQTEGSKNLKEMINYDIASHKKGSPHLEIKDGESISLGERKISTKYFFGDKNNYEAVAYIDEPKAVVFVVLSSRTKAGFESSLPAFKEIIGNFKLIASKVQFGGGKSGKTH
jgi:hypothetical protein